jgi:hypothetical protein
VSAGELFVGMGEGGGREWKRSQIMRLEKRMVLYKSLKILSGSRYTNNK